MGDAGRKPRVLMVGPFPPTRGGVTTFMLNVIGSGLSDRFDFVPHTTSRPAKKNVVDNYGYAAMFKGGIGRLLKAGWVTLWHLVTFPFVLVFRRIDLVQIQSSDFQTFWESCLYLMMAKLFRRPTMLRLGGVFDKFYEGSSPRVQALIRRGVAAPDILIVQSESWRSYLAGVGRSGDVIVLYNSIPEATIVPVDAPRNTPPRVVFFAGSESVRKGAQVVIAALKHEKIADLAVSLRFVAVIDPLKSQIEAEGLPQDIELTGFMDHAQFLAELRQGDIFLMPSFGEGFPNSLLEAMAAGCACIATPVGAVPEIVEHEVEALVMQPGDDAALAEMIRRLAEDADLRLRLVAAAQERLRRQFTAERVLERLEAGYETLLGKRAA
ncbi:MAG: glycosyltransferase family 4 protein [Minwuia sp.]|uniref:glycosyltransferase family 4 protein n=1 Tax=Minwuia sp. TaxID=2493630 RepID=UPI003A835C21